MAKNKMVNSGDDLVNKSPASKRKASMSEDKKEIFNRKDNVIEKMSFGSDDNSGSAYNLRESDNSLGFDIPSGKTALQKDSEEVRVKEVVKRKVRHDRGSGVRSLLFTVSYLVIVIVLAVVLSHYIITRANDAFAFLKEDITVEITIDDPNMSLEALAELLYEKGAINYPDFFQLYVKLKNDGEFVLKEGTHTFSSNNNYDVILSNLNPVPPRETVTITIPEGFTTCDVIDLLVSKGIGTEDGFEDAIQNAELNYWFLKPLDEKLALDDKMRDARIHRLDGYLYPDTYYFYTTSSEVSVLKKILNNFGKKFNEAYADRCKELGITIDEALILASIIQSEAKYVADYEFVSAVLHNRMKSKNVDRFDCDATLQYFFRHKYGARHPELTAEDLRTRSPYNTRITYEGIDFFTPGPICNPSLTAIKAALYPSNRDFCYFVSKPNGYNVYSSTYAQHQKYASMTPEELSKVDQGLYGGDNEG